MKEKNTQKQGIYLFKLFGFEVSIDWSWFILAFLVTWSLAAIYFPFIYKGLSVATYWSMGVVGTLGLFISIILHELCHSLVARYYDLPITGIKLFIFGGVAQMDDDPPSPKAEFLMAVVGPIASIVLGFLFTFLFYVGTQMNWPIPINGVFRYLAFINFVLAIFNLFPGFPLDGGRILRSILWWIKKDIKWATRISSWLGRGLGIALIFLGIYFILTGNFISGAWFILIGFFLQQISKMSYRQLLIKQAFSNETVKQYVKTNVVTVPPDITIQTLVNDYFYQHYHKLYPVLSNENLIGFVTLNNIKQISKDKWDNLHVREIMSSDLSEVTIDAKTKVTEALSKMNSIAKSRLIVTENHKLYGIITLKDLMNAVSMKLDIEEANKK